MAFTIAVVVRRSPAAVFAYLSDGTRTPQWYAAIRSARQLTPGATTVGTRYRFVRALPGGHAENVVEVTEHVPNTRITLSSVSGPTPFTYRYELAGDRDGDATRLRLDGEINGAGLPGVAALLAPLAPPLFARGMRSNLATLKELLERP